MVTGAIKNKVDKIWTDIWAGGITNPLTVIEQLTYLMFIRSLDEKELATEDFENMAGEKMEHIFPASEAGQSMRWSRFKDKDSREIFLTMQQRVFPAIKKMKYGRLPDFDANGELVEIEDDPTRPDEGNTAFARYMDDAMFLIPTPQVLQKIITGLEDLYTHDIADLDMQGDLYEYMLGKLATAGQNGQFRTPKHIRDMMVELVQPTPDDFICDPACGTAGFLVSSAQYLRAHYEDSMTPEQWQHFAGPMFTGFDTDRTMLRIYGHEPDAPLHHESGNRLQGQRVEAKLHLQQVHRLPCEPAVQGHCGCREHQRRPESRHQHQKDGAFVPCALSANAQNRRTLRLHRAGRRTVRFQ